MVGSRDEEKVLQLGEVWSIDLEGEEEEDGGSSSTGFIKFWS